MGRVILGLLVLAVGLPAGENFTCTRTVDAYDVNHPAQMIGRFEPPTALEIEEYVASAKMFRVLYRAPDGKEIRALCRPDAIGKNPPPEAGRAGSANPLADSAKPGASARDSGAFQPPLFAALAQFQPNVWETPSSKFALQQSSYGFRWVSLAENTESRWAPHPNGPVLKFLGQPLCESIVRFKGGRLDEIRLLLFNRGDAKKAMPENEFDRLLKDTEGALSQWVGSPGLDTGASDRVLDTRRKAWFKFPLRVDLEWSATPGAGGGDGFRAEFVRLVVTSYDGKTDVASLVKPGNPAAPAATVKGADLKTRVRRDASGDVYLDGVPMVDQGQKGYCVCASCERVMRYFGLEIDQNEMAKLANTVAGGGTSSSAMQAALRKLGEQFSLVVEERIGFGVKDFLREVENYNELARKRSKAEITVPTSGAVNVSAIYAGMDPGLRREAALAGGAEGKARFKQEVAASIEQGIPLLWSAELGLVEETPALRQLNGGHMRLIIGYNAKKTEIIYTDSWGTGHEFKKMKEDDAFRITRGLYLVRPGS